VYWRMSNRVFVDMVSGPEHIRRDRDERDRPRSRVRDSSRHRGDPSVSRRDRDRDRDREDKDRARGEREREDSRRDRDDFRREREREADREVEFDDPRRWRDDGKRDERMAARRGDRYPDQYRDKERIRDKDSSWDATAERRWVSVEERDGRSKRISGREKRTADGTKAREDRRDRERDQEKEKEPAWMDTYIPNPSSGSILSGKGADGELDGIQAWKKGMKEKELKAVTHESNGVQPSQPIPDEQLDEIQLFRLLMRREEEKKKSDNVDALAPLLGIPSPTVNTVANLTNLQDTQVLKASEGVLKFHRMCLCLIGCHPDNLQNFNATSVVQGIADQSSHLDTKIASMRQSEILLPIPDYKESSKTTPNPSSASLEPSTGGLMAPLSSQVILNHTSQETSVPDTERTPSTLPPQFNPPQGSRLLAFARTPSATIRPQAPIGKPPNGTQIVMFCWFCTHCSTIREFSDHRYTNA